MNGPLKEYDYFKQAAREDLPAPERPIPRLKWADGPQGRPWPAREDASLLPRHQDNQQGEHL